MLFPMVEHKQIVHSAKSTGQLLKYGIIAALGVFILSLMFAILHHKKILSIFRQNTMQIINKPVIELDGDSGVFHRMPSASNSITDYNTLLSKAATQRVRVIVTLNLPTYKPDGTLSPHEREVQRMAIKEIENRVIVSLSADNHVIVAANNIFPNITLEANAQALTTLRNSSDVLYIQEDPDASN